MDPISNKAVSGNVVQMVRTNPGHMDSNGKTGSVQTAGERNFGNAVTDALGEISARENHVEQLFEQMVTNPDSVEPHEITTAMAQAELSLNLTKTVVDRAVKAYNDIISMR